MATRQPPRWHNWSGSVQAHPRQIEKPGSIAALKELVGTCGRTGRHIRVVGSGHSFTPLVHTDDVLISLDNLQGVESMDEVAGTVTVLAGTKLKYLGETLLARGLAQENLGDVDAQSIAGAISTGTHGTGINFGNLATQVEALTLVTADGELLECSASQHPDIFKAAQISLGTLGVIARVKLRVISAQLLHFKSRRETLANCLAHLEDYKNNNDHFEFYWLPYTPWVQTKFLNETTVTVSKGNLWSSFNQIVLENGLFWLLSEISRLLPASARTISRLSAQGIATTSEVNYSHRLYATLRVVRFQEMEYNIPAEHFTSVLQEIRACIDKHQFAVHFPIECRFARADDIWLSSAYQRTSAYIAIHMYKGMPYQEYFQSIEAIFKRYQGRPHWGKLHTRDAASLAQLYPRWQDFRRIRATLDPQGIFLNDYLCRLLDVPDTSSGRGQQDTEAARESSF
ncbi:D-arabinono-1,4-lactone oxidase [Dictyobacter arantiisoli]|uniref:FAD-binding oxidoreductase n=1 Tax=Dictyobacter arantiisoli TaxID=2014874 RepID=A0A5A5TD16_9CHLR|nr:D-arabinono-1,4-lactone oxidase [Dictyobacter arantiisoli]GCF08923.1 FAD-binding oxidoreductase [Dictyobacter arantiisoli]